VILVALVVVVSGAAGALVARHHGDRAQLTSRRLLDGMLYALFPFVAFFNLAHLQITSGVGAGLGIAYLELACVGLIAWVLGDRLLGLRRPETGALICATVLVNTGYLGLPLTSAVLGHGQLPAAIAFDTLVSAPVLLTFGFGAGAAFGERAGSGVRERVRAFLVRNPPLLASVAGLLAPAALAPPALVDASNAAVFAMLPAGFFVLGVNLQTEGRHGSRLSGPARRAVAAAVLLRLLVAPGLMLVLAAQVAGVPDAYLLQAAMPSGIATLLVAHAYGLDLRLCSAALAWSTAIVVSVSLGASLV
jgi:hypothetical protein